MKHLCSVLAVLFWLFAAYVFGWAARHFLPGTPQLLVLLMWYVASTAFLMAVVRTWVAFESPRRSPLAPK